MVSKLSSKQKNNPLFDSIKAYTDKCPSIIQTFFKSFIVSGEDFQFEKVHLRNELDFNVPFFLSSPLNNLSEETDSFKKLLNLLKREKIVSNSEIKPLNIEETKQLIKRHPQHKGMLELVDNGELEYWNFKISLSIKTEKLETLQRFYDTLILDLKSETYSRKKQHILVSKYLLKKINSFGKEEISLNLFTITEADPESLVTDGYNDDSQFLSKHDAKHIRIMATLRDLESLGYFEITNIIYNDNAIPLIVDIKLSRDQYKKIVQYYKKSLPHKSESSLPDTKKSKIDFSKQLITKQGNDFFYKGIPIELGEGTIYKDILDVLYLFSVQEDFLSYRKIDAELKERGWKEVPPKKIAKRIQNALNNSMFRFAKLNGKKLKNETPSGKPLIEIVKGRGLRLNNTL